MNVKELLQSTTEPMPKGTLYEIIKAKRIEKERLVSIEEMDSLDEEIKNIKKEFGNLKNFFNILNNSNK